MKKDYKIIGLVVVIAACLLSIVDHVSVLRPVPTFSEYKNPVPTSSLTASVINKVVSATRIVEVTEVKVVAPKGTYITLIADGTTYYSPATSTQTILETMRAFAETTDFSFSGTEFPGMGFFVDEINHKKSEGGYYWMLYVNMRAAQKGISQTMVSPSDTILWQYDKNRHE